MAKTIIIQVAGIPTAQARPRACIRGKRAGVYDPGTAKDWKSLIAIAAKRHLPRTPIQEPVRIRIQYFLPRPQKLMRKKDAQQALPHTGKPDIDNLDKAVLDILSLIGMWKDDRFVYDKYSTKHYHSKDGRPGALIRIEVGAEDGN